jgi:Ca2+-binding RTX toxin-like protein
VIEGGAGNDLITGGAGDDMLTGGAGADTFVYLAGAASGSDTIIDFDLSGNDVIRFVGFDFGGASDDQARRNALSAASTFNSRGAVIDLDAIGGDGTILLAGVRSLSFASAEDFLFSA